jgi:hypothetical protein
MELPSPPQPLPADRMGVQQAAQRVRPAGAQRVRRTSVPEAPPAVAARAAPVAVPVEPAAAAARATPVAVPVEPTVAAVLSPRVVVAQVLRAAVPAAQAQAAPAETLARVEAEACPALMRVAMRSAWVLGETLGRVEAEAYPVLMRAAMRRVAMGPAGVALWDRVVPQGRVDPAQLAYHPPQVALRE